MSARETILDRDTASVPAKRRLNPLGLLCIGAALALLAYVPTLPNYYLRIADLVLIYIILGMGLNIVIGYVGLLDLGFVAFYAVGAYCYALLSSNYFDIHLPFLAVLVVAAFAGGITGILLGIPVLRLRGDYLAIVTLGFGEIIRILINNVDWLTNGPRGITGIDRLSLFGYQVSTPMQFYFLLLALAVVTGVLVYRLERSILGKAWFALREDQDAAVGVGIDKTRVKLIAFATSAVIGSTCGVIFAAFQRFVSPESFTLNESILVVLVIVIGGIGNIVGIVVGAVVLVVMPELLREYAEYRMLLFGLLLVGVIVMRPRGIVPQSLTPVRLISKLVWK
ncbi:branched-chain amino acid ABC transporter permease [Pararhizobium polonicum]|uniref:branched-chain amino acid ABC transporter permease n=1 Tax=Pararhizobium polonicum TaxID=1612624 RepID=UPI0009F1DEC4|nr:branched-chain amino acid ABC transporter permease [Pararhizobium polonicum]